jgi:hypothetical protein
LHFSLLALQIPFTRWLGFVWLIVGGFKLENHRRKCDRRNRGS